MALVLKCDRCGFTQQLSWEPPMGSSTLETNVTYRKSPGYGVGPGLTLGNHLCNSCIDSFQKWIKDGLSGKVDSVRGDSDQNCVMERVQQDGT